MVRAVRTGACIGRRAAEHTVGRVATKAERARRLSSQVLVAVRRADYYGRTSIWARCNVVSTAVRPTPFSTDVHVLVHWLAPDKL